MYMYLQPVLNGYEGHEDWKQHYYHDDDSTRQWTDRWVSFIIHYIFYMYIITL